MPESRLLTLIPRDRHLGRFQMVELVCAKCGNPGTATDYLIRVRTQSGKFFHGTCLKQKPKPKLQEEEKPEPTIHGWLILLCRGLKSFGLFVRSMQYVAQSDLIISDIVRRH